MISLVNIPCILIRFTLYSNEKKIGRDTVRRERWERNILFRLFNYLWQNFHSRINSLFHHLSPSATQHNITSYVPHSDPPR